jgi:hypothetical protein
MRRSTHRPPAPPDGRARVLAPNQAVPGPRAEPSSRDRIADVGYGYWGSEHVRVLCSTPGVEGEETRLAQAAARYPSAVLASRHEDVLVPRGDRQRRPHGTGAGGGTPPTPDPPDDERPSDRAPGAGVPRPPAGGRGDPRRGRRRVARVVLAASPEDRCGGPLLQSGSGAPPTAPGGRAHCLSREARHHGSPARQRTVGLELGRGRGAGHPVCRELAARARPGEPAADGPRRPAPADRVTAVVDALRSRSPHGHAPVVVPPPVVDGARSMVRG